MQEADVQHNDPTTWAIVQNFMKIHPNIKVTVSGQPVAVHDQMIAVAAQSHTLPTIFWVNNADTDVQLAKAGALLDLSPMVQTLGLGSKIAPNVLSGFKFGDKQVGLPQSGLITGFYYNKKILSDNGLSVPATFNDLLHVATVLHSKGITTISDGANQSAFSVWAFLTCLDRFGYDSRIGPIIKGSASFNNPTFLRFYTHLQQLQKAGAFSSNVTTQTYNQAVADFSAGKAAFLDSGVWTSGALQSLPIAADVGFWNGPTFTDGVGNQNIAMDVVGAPLSVSGSVKPGSSTYAAVQKFLQYYYSDAAQQIFVTNGGPPVTNYVGTVPASSSVFRAVLDAAHGKPVPNRQPDQYLTSAAQNALYDSLYGVIEGQLTPQDAIKTAATAIDGSSK